ncbi:exodeoxyribonuclease V subunit alpha [Aerolutibacter daejeonensis]|uniref:exodeoxyribonuclease V subunit alpha n=1 Tax=Aerolutibacter daejeonensis TaxID=346181 RepID=UPI000AF1B0DF|nr:exodeoxyribonuclease V subunit alpha [Lysobacter daejeonensis]
MNLPVARGFHFRPVPGFEPPEAWSSLDHAVARWVLAHGGDVRLARLAGWASAAESRGDAALLLTAEGAQRLGMPWSPDLPAAVQAMADDAGDAWVQRTVGEVVPASPFVLDGEAFFLRRNFLHETAVAGLVRHRRAACPTPAHAITDDDLRDLFNSSTRDEEAPQRAAVRQAPGKRLFVLTGGPGTGKTTTVLRMLLALVREHTAAHAGRAPVVRIAAPTGKAAQRLTESLRRGGVALHARPPSHGADAESATAARPWSPLPSTWQPHLDSLATAESGTLHRLLGSRGGQGGFAHHREHRLPADIVVVDEASMIDLALLRALLEALRDDAVLVLVGDADQLTSVGTGSVLADLVAALEGGDAPDLVRLRHCFRADRLLVPINDAVRNGDVAAFQDAWRAAGSQAVRHAPLDRRALDPLLSAWARRVETALSQACAFDVLHDADPAAARRALSALHAQQLLCALREGPFGAVDANARIEHHLRRSETLAEWAGADWYPGRAVMVVRNDYASNLFNGDVGLCLRVRLDDGREVLRVAFEGVAGNDSEGDTPAVRWFDPDTLPAHEGAFALTVHKSQGSEYRHVALLLPPVAEHPLLVRQMLYTGLSRARQSVELWGTSDAVIACMDNALTRAGRLRERIGG